MRNVGKNRKSNRKKDGKKEENAGRIRNTRTKDSGAKLIFDNHILCAQFLRGYTDVDLLKDVQAEDIEDITERFLWMWQEGRDSDSVKKIRLKGIPGVETLYLIVLIEHQSKVDHDMPFRMNVPKEEVEEFTDRIERRDFTVLFENFEAYDVQETRRISRAEGKCEGKAEFLIEILEDIGPVSEEVKTRILSERDPEQLKKWRRAAVKAESVEQFVENMKTEKPLE